MRSQVKTFNFLPFEYEAQGLRTKVHDVLLDGTSVAEISPDAQLITLEERVDDDWDTGRVRGEVVVTDDVLRHVLPADEHGSAPLQFILVHRCNETFTRNAETLFDVERPIEELADEYEFEFEFQLEDYRGSIELQPLLVRTTSRDEAPGSHSGQKHERVADARPWEIRLDRKKGPPGNYLDIRFEDFQSRDAFPDNNVTLYYLKADGSNPILWLNKSHSTIARVLKAKGTRGGSARMREVFYDQITVAVWSQLFSRALVDLNEDGEVQYDWQDAALGHFGDLLYPNMDYEEQLTELYATAEDQEGFVELMRRADVELQCDTELSSHMKKLVDEVEGT